ncbi:MAG TPA: hypothetical protein VFW45_13005 [Candidatus Polarisedimenticolia bacterium]|nr:hypothetical protein [Candidatus Polarisedimenticolia bacterium]
MHAPCRVPVSARRTSSLALIALFFLLILAAGISPLAAQIDPVVYRLDKSSTFQKGCFDPCMCPVMFSGSERGTFVLRFTGSDPLYDNYRVEEVNWTVTVPGQEIRVTGSGTYRVGGEVALQQQLILDLSVDGAAAEHFDSGLVTGGGGFPRIAITISIHGQVCFDTVFRLSAAPVPASELKAYRLSPESRFLRGCSDPCDCPTLDPVPVRGSFTLVPLERGPLGTEFSVVQVKWLVSPDPIGGDPSGLSVTGSGTYRLSGEVAAEQQMKLDLKLGTDPPVAYDSGLVPGGGGFPLLDVTIQRTVQTCLTTAFELHAKPVRMCPRASGAIPD